MKFLNTTVRAAILIMVMLLQMPMQAFASSFSEYSTQLAPIIEVLIVNGVGHNANNSLIGIRPQSFSVNSGFTVKSFSDNVSKAVSEVAATGMAISGTRRTVCADSLIVRGGGAPGYYIGELKRGDSFLVVREGQVYAYGFAYGRVNKWGHVIKRYLC